MAGLLGNGTTSHSKGGGLLFAANEKREKERVDAFQRSLHTSPQQAIDAVKANAPELIPVKKPTEGNVEKKSPLKWLGDNLMSGIGAGNKALYGALQSIGGDKIPGVSKALDTAVKVSERDILKGGEDIGSKFVQAIPNAATSLGMAAMTGGASLAPQLGKSVTQQAIQTTLRNPVFYNSLLRSYGGAYNEAREAGQDRGTAITAGLLTGIPEALVEQSGGIEQVFKRPAQGLLPAIGRTALEEAGEEVLQSPIGGAVKKALYAPETPIYSTTEEAIINPVETGKAALIGGTMGGLMGGTGKAIESIQGRRGQVTPTIQENVAEPKIEPMLRTEPATERARPIFYTDPYGNTSTDINKAPLLLPEAKQTVKPQMPTAEELAILNNPTIETDAEANFPKLDNWSINQINMLVSELKNDRQKILDEQVNWLKKGMGQGVEQGGLIRDQWGDVVGRYGRISNNEKWYQDWAKENNYRRPTKAELYEIATQQLYEGVQTNYGFVPPIEEYIQTDEFIDYAESQLNSSQRKADIQDRLAQYEAEKQREFYTVPFSAKREAPFTAVRPIGNMAESVGKTTAAPIGGDIKQDVQPMLYTGDTQQTTRPIGEPLPDPVNKVVMDSPKEKMTFKDALKNFYTKTVDTQQPIVDFSKAAEDRTSVLASNTRNVGGTVDFIFTDGLVDKQGNKIGDSLKTVTENIPKGREADFWTYMMQRHNIDRAREGKHVIPNYTPEMSQQATGEFEAKNPEYKAIGDKVTNWIDSFMKEWGVDSGLIDSEVYSGMREMYQSYFPTQREFSQLESSMPENVRKQFVDSLAPIRKATGSARDVNNPVENIMGLVNRTVRTARYNEAGQSLLNSVRKAPDKLRPFAEVVDSPSNTDNVVSVLENGKPVYLQINNKPLLDALKGLPKVVNNAKTMRKITGVFKGLITQKNPFFAIRNMARDIPTAYVYGSEANPFIFGGDLVKSAKDVMTNSERYQRYRAVGGGMSGFFKGDTQQAAKNITKKGFHPLAALENANNMIEIAPRLAEFNRVYDSTGDVQQALDASNNVTVNFARGGNVTKSIEPYVPYLNAGVQGLDKFFKAFKNPKAAVATLIKGGVMVTLPEIALYLINRDKEEYKELDNRTKDTYFVIPKGDGTFFKIPKSMELGVIFGSLFQRIARAAEGESEPFKGYGTSLATSFSPANPIENNIFAPAFINIPKNKDFAGRNIVPMGMQMDKRFPYLQYDERTSELAKTVGALMNEVVEGGVSPKHVDYLIDAYTGIIGDIIIPATTQGGDPLEMVKRQFISDPLYSNQALQDFYENYDELQQKATSKNIIEGLPTSGKKNIVTPEEKIRNKFSKASSEISKINKQIKMLEASFEIDKDEKMRELRRQILDIAKEANELLGAAK